MSNNSSGNFADYFSADGRISRWDYFVNSAIILGATLFAFLLSSIGGLLEFLAYLIFLPIAWVSVCTSIRRQHDLGRSGWWCLFFLVPVANLLMSLNLLFAAGQEEANIYGPAPGKPESPLKSPASPTFVPTPATQLANPVLPVEAERSPSESVDRTAVSDDEGLWAKAMQEVEGSARRAGLWARVFSMSEGDENKAKAAYIGQRVLEMQAEQIRSHEEQQRLAREALERKLAQGSALAVLAMKASYMAKGQCPSCESQVLMQASFCPHCEADFGEGSSWRPKEINAQKAQVADQEESVGLLIAAGYQCTPYEAGFVISQGTERIAYAFSPEDLHALAQLAKRKKQLSRWVGSIATVV